VLVMNDFVLRKSEQINIKPIDYDKKMIIPD